MNHWQELNLSLTPQEALIGMTQQLDKAGGSFKKLTKQQAESVAAAAADAPRAGSGISSSKRRGAMGHSVVDAGVAQQVAHLQVEPLQLPAAAGAML